MRFLKGVLILLVLMQYLEVFSQERDLVHYGYEVQAIGTTDSQVPFWMRTNQFGSIPTYGISSSVIGNVRKDYVSKKREGYYNPDSKKIDWGYGVTGRANIGQKSEIILVEAYVKAKIGAFEIKGGRTKDIIGIVDSSLSSGSFSVSGNSLGIPKIEVSIPEYTRIPFLSDFFAFKGNFSAGWFGTTPLNQQSTFITRSVTSYYHQKSLYFRLGKPEWRVKLFGGVNHQVMWGNERKIFGSDRFKLGYLQSLFYVVTGQAYGGSNYDLSYVPRSKIGNHIGSVDQGMEVELDKITITGYHQFFYDVGGLFHLNNIKDGLFGLVIKRNPEVITILGWDKFLIEVLSSKSQGGELNAKITPSGDENYYNNFYSQGWSYRGENIGNNLLTNRKYGRTDLPALGTDYIINNRVMAVNLGLEGHINQWSYSTKLTVSQNYGTYGASPIGKSRNRLRFISPPPYFETENQISGYFQVGRLLNKGYSVSLAIAADKGGVLYNSFGSLFSVKKQW